MSYYFAWRPYVPVAEKRRLASRKLAKLRKRGQSLDPLRSRAGRSPRPFGGNRGVATGAVQRLSKPAAARPRLRPEWLRPRSANRERRDLGHGCRVRALQGQDRHCANFANPLEIHLSGLRRND